MTAISIIVLDDGDCKILNIYQNFLGELIMFPMSLGEFTRYNNPTNINKQNQVGEKKWAAPSTKGSSTQSKYFSGAGNANINDIESGAITRTRSGTHPQDVKTIQNNNQVNNTKDNEKEQLLLEKEQQPEQAQKLSWWQRVLTYFDNSWIAGTAARHSDHNA